MSRTTPKPPCVYCGDTPVNHVVQFIDSSLEVCFGMITPKPKAHGFRFWQIHSSPTVKFLGRVCMDFLMYIQLIRASNDIDLALTKRTRVVWEEAVRRGIQMEQLIVLGKVIEQSRAHLPTKYAGEKFRFHYFQSIPVPPFRAESSSTWVDDKDVFKSIFQKEHLAVARGVCVITLQGALRAFSKINGPVIVKPRSGSRARHTSVNIVGREDFIEAYKRARQLCLYVMIEEYVPGDTYRALCVGQKVVGIIAFKKARVLGDGISTCDELLLRYNEKLDKEKVSPVKRDSWYFDALMHAGFSPKQIPLLGFPLLLAEHSERSNGGYNVDITDLVPQHTKEEIERASRVCEIEVIGFDIISEDLTNPDERFTFIEGNSLPYIEIHHDPTYGPARDVAGVIWDMWFPQNIGVLKKELKTNEQSQ